MSHTEFNSNSQSPMDITKIHKSNQSIKKLLKEVVDSSQRSPNGLFYGGWGQMGLLWHHSHVKSRPTLIDTHIILLIFHLESLENMLISIYLFNIQKIQAQRKSTKPGWINADFFHGLSIVCRTIHLLRSNWAP